ncbi:unnamed protein product, partial [Rotaria sp. Silwood2]
VFCVQSSLINYCSPSNPDHLSNEIEFQSKLDTNLFQLIQKKNKLIPLTLEFSLSEK